MVRRPPSPNAHALYAWLETEWANMGIKPTAWCRKVGLADATIFRWRDEGCEPDVATLKKVAEALERPLIDILIAANYITPDETGGYKAPERTYDLLETLRLDTGLSPHEREAHRHLHDAFALAS